MLSSGSGRERSLATSPAVTRSPARGHSLEEGVDRTREVGTEDERRRRARRDQALDELVGDLVCVVDRLEASLLGQGALVEPLEQRHAQGPDDPDLGVVDVRVDHAGQDQSLAEVDHLVSWMVAHRLGEGTARGDAAVVDDERGVGLGAEPDGPQRGVARRVEDRPAEDGHLARSCSAPRREAASLSSDLSSAAATPIATVDGSLPPRPGRPIGEVIRAIVSGA